MEKHTLIRNLFKREAAGVRPEDSHSDDDHEEGETNQTEDPCSSKTLEGESHDEPSKCCGQMPYDASLFGLLGVTFGRLPALISVSTVPVVLNSKNSTGAVRLGNAVLRSSLALVLIWIGSMKFTSYEAMGIQPLVATSPLMSWLYVLASKSFPTCSALPNLVLLH
jgi:uncharacterized protein DUF417